MKVLVAAFILWCVIGAVVLPSEPAPSLRLTRLSSREWVDLSKVSMIRLPVFTDPHGCLDCQTRWGADLVVDGVETAYTEEAEVTLRRLLAEQN